MAWHGMEKHEDGFSSPLTITSTVSPSLCPPAVVTVTVRRTNAPAGNLSTAMAISGPGPPESTVSSQVDTLEQGIGHSQSSAGPFS